MTAAATPQLFDKDPPRLVRLKRALYVTLVWALGAAPFLLVPPSCFFSRAFGHPCPGCGMTRALALLGRGDWLASLHMHPFAVPVLASQILLALLTIVVTVTDGSPFAVVTRRTYRKVLYGLGAVYVLTGMFWVLRAYGFFGGPVPI